MRSRVSFVRISALLWADILVAYALFVMQNYLTDVWKLSLTHAAAILNLWNGTYRILSVFFLFFVDSSLGNFKLLVVTSIAYAVGIGCVALSAPPILANSTHTCKEYEPECIGHTQKSLLYAGLALIAVGVAGNLVSVKPFLNEQKPRETTAATGDPYQVLGIIGVRVAGAVALPYIKPWTLRFGIPAICTVVGTTLFLSGSCHYKKKPPGGSPICNVCRVFVSAALNAFKSYPYNSQSYHGIDERKFSKTIWLEGLHKAAIRPANVENRETNNNWRLCSVADVEDAKIVVRMVPMSMTFIICSVVASAGDTYFVQQAGTLNRNIGKLKLPIQVLLLARTTTKYWLDSKLERGFRNRNRQTAPAPPFWMKYNGAPSIGIATGMICAILCCISAAGVEKRRLAAVNKLDKPDEDVPMSIYWLLFQFVLLGGLDSFLEKSVNAYYKEHASESLETYLENFTRGVSGLGFTSSVLYVYVVGRISERGGGRNWFQETLNMSRLDRYYWVLAALSSVNLVVFVFVSVFVVSRYRYNGPRSPRQDEIDRYKEQRSPRQEEIDRYNEQRSPRQDEIDRYNDPRSPRLDEINEQWSPRQDEIDRYNEPRSPRQDEIDVGGSESLFSVLLRIGLR